MYRPYLLTMKRVSFYTLGCRLNFSETGSIINDFTNKGHRVVPFGEKADVTFINTCTVTEKADSTCRNLIRRARQYSPRGKIVVAGCYSQMESRSIAGMKEVDLVLGTSEKFKVFDYLNTDGDTGQNLAQTGPGARVHVTPSRRFFQASSASSDMGGSHTRSFLKIQDGCNYRCSFCIIPQARGASRSISIDEAVAHTKLLVEKRGFKEIVLTGVNIGEYGQEHKTRLSALLKAILKVKGLQRLRLSSVEPNTLTDEVLVVLQDSGKFMPHFHIPLQSGNDDILKKMRRRYRVQQYEDTIRRIIQKFPQASIGADMICGFPGENEKQFLDTYHLAQKIPLTHFHVFPYSVRKNTQAASMENQIPLKVKRKRVKKLITLGKQKLFHFSKKQLGLSAQVLFEKQDECGQWWGYTPNYLRVAVPGGNKNLNNEIHQVFHYELQDDFLTGRLMDKV